MGRRGGGATSANFPKPEDIQALRAVALPCGCLRGQVCCDPCLKLVLACQRGYEIGMKTGDWLSFENARMRYEDHLRGE